MLFSLFRRTAPAVTPPPSAAPLPDATADGDPLERRTLELGRELLQLARRHQAGVLSRQFWQDKLMNWAMKDPQFKVQLFRFVDTFPSLRDPEAVHEHLVDYLSQPGVTLPPGLGLGLAAGSLTKGLLTRTVTSQIESMAGHFIAGTDAASALPLLQRRWNDGVAFSVDLLGEACVSQAEADEYRRRYLDLIGTLPAEVARWKSQPLLETDHLGAIPRTNVSIKISALTPKLDPVDFEGSIERAYASIRPLLELACTNGVFVNFDMEHSALKDLTLTLFERCCQRHDFHAGLAMQAYLRSADDDAARLIRFCRSSGRVVTVRLVKGAYWDSETLLAEQHGWPTPVWSSKRDTDACFERLARAFADAMPSRPGEGGVKLALGSHNLRSIAAALAAVERRGLPPSAIELQMLYGMADALKAVAVERGLRLREYVPVGEMIPGMAYLVRRLLENTSNESWLRAGFLDDASEAELLSSPHPPPPPRLGPTLPELARRHALSAAPAGFDTPFFTEPLRDFSDPRQRESFARAVRSAIVPMVVVNATEADADRAVKEALAAFPAWRDAGVDARAGVLRQVAAMMRSDRDRLAGIIVRENGKNWRNADADVTEAIDFAEFYAREAVELMTPRRLGRFAGEHNELRFQPRGVAAVIAPWNFPLAIAAGMTFAALVTGNPVVLKPAEQTPGIAKYLAEAVWAALADARLPRAALQFVPGLGETVGRRLVRHPDVRLIAFTGSREVGLDILSAVAPASPFTPNATVPDHLKHVVCEMGGKNAIIVDTSADLDEAVLGVRESAFGFSGQKCSACSRLIVVGNVYEALLARLVESTRALVLGDPLDPATDLGPVIDDVAARRLHNAIDRARRDCTLALAVDRPDLGFRYIGPHIFTDVPESHFLWTDELFGPVLAVARARDFEHALQMANASTYKLTGGVYSRKPSHLLRARLAFDVGNLYLNRPITGALVGRQPFGGHGLSGLGTKAGGREYLLQFVHTRCVTENTLRRGFAPEA
ncbi:MAG: proline dehydrogenase family protein [Tepidisphaerales bacterium]